MDSTINMISQNFTLTKGDSLSFTITIEDSEIAPDDITFIVKENINSDIIIIKKILNGGITRTEDEGYVYEVFIPYTDTEDLKLLNYIYQIELTFGADRETVCEGKFIITPEV